ncbi:MAG: Multidrug resistance protein MdtC [Flavobacteriaceae bacterium]|jgi:predicted RND superfamily exporter protein|nr:MMPL family transporter [Flavobacteriaceae bacterium]CAI8197565.1 MAG: Multidrug resistance protein MdtC [Flavobacteriaceae bacterium]
MGKLATFFEGFWPFVARIILRNRVWWIAGLVLLTAFFVSQWRHVKFSNEETSVLPTDHPEIIKYTQFTDVFGAEDNAILIAVEGRDLFTANSFNAWNRLSKQLEAAPEIVSVVSLDNIEEIVRSGNQLEAQAFNPREALSDENAKSKLYHLFERLPFYENLIYDPNSRAIRTIAFMDPDVVNTKVRSEFILNEFKSLVENFERASGADAKISGMPYIKTRNAETLKKEMILFVIGALLVTALIFFFFFRSYRATFISMVVVLIGVSWSFGIIGLLGFEITILTALIPPLIIVIGIPNCIFLINKYQQEVKKHGNQARSLIRVISKVGNATLMTNLTTASGFATFIILSSSLLREFGIVASINIIGIFILSLLIIPIIYSYMSLPKNKHLQHLNTPWIDLFVKTMENIVREHRITVYITSVVLLVLSIIGIYQIEITGSRIEDLPKNTDFYEDILFYEKDFNGILPVEILVDTGRENGALSGATLSRVEKLSEEIGENPELSTPLSISNLFKYAKQAYYKGLRKYYQLPTRQERNFILDAANTALSGEADLTSSMVDSEKRRIRLSLMMKDVKTSRMEEIEEDLNKSIEKIFPKERYDVALTGKALLYLKGTRYLVNNLVLSLFLAVVLISLLMAYLFRSFQMIIISLVPNLLPLIITAGIMGFIGVPIKPSTILIFSIAFGISVDDTIHFLAKYRQELVQNNWQIKKSVYAALKETGVSMFYTSIVLFFGFSVFMISNYGGTKALGGLISATLLFAMLANLVLLPCLLLSLERNIANNRVLKQPKIDILPKDVETEA